MKVYFDSCIWIDYAISLLSDRGKPKPYIVQLFQFVESQQIDVVFSPFITAEIFNHLRDWYLMKKMMEDGFSYREFSRKKKSYSLTNSEAEKIHKLIKEIFKIHWVTPSEIRALDEVAFLVFEQYTLQFSIDTIDTLHIIAAAQKQCRYLITKDEEMIVNLNEALALDGMIQFLEALQPTDFYKKI